MTNQSNSVFNVKGNTIDLSQYGITNVEEIYYNPVQQLYEHEMNPALEGFERGVLTTSGCFG